MTKEAEQEDNVKSPPYCIRQTFPLFGLSHVPNTSGLFVGGGGGGGAATGVPNALVLLRLGEGGEWEKVQTLSTESKAPNDVDVHPSGDQAAVALGGECGIVSISKEKLTMEKSFKADFGEDDGYLKIVKFDHKGKLLATGGGDNKIRLWSFPSLKLLKTLEGHTNEPNDICFSPDSTLLATVARDKTCRIWRTNSSECQKVLKCPGKNPRESFRHCRFSRDGLFLYTTETGPAIKSKISRWSVGEWNHLKSSELSKEPVSAIDLSPSGSLFVVCDAEGQIAFVSEGSLKRASKWLVKHNMPVSKACFYDDKQIVTASIDQWVKATTVPEGQLDSTNLIVLGSLLALLISLYISILRPDLLK